MIQIIVAPSFCPFKDRAHEINDLQLLKILSCLFQEHKCDRKQTCLECIQSHVDNVDTGGH